MIQRNQRYATTPEEDLNHAPQAKDHHCGEYWRHPTNRRTAACPGEERMGAGSTCPLVARGKVDQVLWKSNSIRPATMTGGLGMIHIAVREACVLLDVQGIERGTDGNVYPHRPATLSRNEVIRPWPAERRARKCHECADQSRLE
jgi:hypothetical protein